MAVKSLPKISVILPTYNRSHFIRGSVHSILEQTFSDFEFIIIDDCSTDDTLEIISQIDDNRIHVIPLKQNHGPAYCRNLGLTEARGDYIALMDSDDISTKERFALQLELMEKNTEITVCGGTLQKFGNDEGYITYPSSHDDLKSKSLFNNPIANPVAMIRANFIRDNQIRYVENLSSCSDYEFWLRILHDYPESRFGNLSHVLALYRMHENNITQMHSSKWRQTNFEIRLPYYERFLGEVTDEDKLIQNNLFHEKKTENKELLLLIKRFFWRLCEGNERIGIYEKLNFRFWMAYKFMEICLASLCLGPWVIKQLLNYPDFYLLGLNSNDVEKLIKQAVAQLDKEVA